MYINEQYKNLELTSKESHLYIGRDGTTRSEEEPVLEEHLLNVYVNEQLTMKLICIPEHLTELVLGRLLTEGIIESTEDVESIYICEYGKRAKVVLKDCSVSSNPTTLSNVNAVTSKGSDNLPTDSSYVEETPTCCTGNHILNDYFVKQMDIHPVTPISWKADWIFALADHFSNGMPLHGQTWATHSCFLAQNGELLFECEDIGRHNALDKAIGYALRHHIDLKNCIVYSSGRIPTDMILKAIRAGIPILSSKASVTKEAIELAEEYHLTLIGAARRDRMKLYTGNEPI